MGDIVAIDCEAATLASLDQGLARFGPVPGEPDWLITGVWLCTDAQSFLATAAAQVLSDGYVARVLTIQPAVAMVHGLKSDLPEVAEHLRNRGSGAKLPEVPAHLPEPQQLTSWTKGSYTSRVLIRQSQRAKSVHQVACGLLFEAEDGASLLVGTDIATLAMVYSSDKALIDRYAEGCLPMTVGEYLECAR